MLFFSNSAIAFSHLTTFTVAWLPRFEHTRYDSTIAAALMPWLRQLAGAGVEVLLGDPRRQVFLYVCFPSNGAPLCTGRLIVLSFTKDAVMILIHSPKRWVITEMSPQVQAATFQQVAEYTLPPALADEHYGVHVTVVYRVLPAVTTKL